MNEAIIGLLLAVGLGALGILGKFVVESAFETALKKIADMASKPWVSEIVELKTEFRDHRTETKADLNAIKGDLNSVKIDVVYVKGNGREVKEALANHEKRLTSAGL